MAIDNNRNTLSSSKSKLIEKIANLIDEKKLPMVSEILDESSEEIRIVVEPRSRNLQPEMLMETLFKLTDLEIKVPLNLNFIDKENIPGVRPLKDTLKLWLEHRNEVLIRRTNFRYEKIAKRINIFDGYLVVFKNLDRVILIIREEDDPKKVLMKEFKLNELQVNSILDMRLRSLRRLEEIELKKEMSDLLEESKELKLLLKVKLCSKRNCF